MSDSDRRAVTDGQVLVRSTWHAVRVPGHASPHDVAHVKVFYPASAEGTDDETQHGELPADRSHGRHRVVGRNR